MTFVSKLVVLVERQVATRLQEAVAGMKKGRRAVRRPVPRGRRLQGRYIGLLRKLSGRTRARVQKVARESGVAAALELAAKLDLRR
jgi:hypothetical protein